MNHEYTKKGKYLAYVFKEAEYPYTEKNTNFP